MIHLANLLTVSLVLVNLAGLALAVRRITGNWLLARSASPLLIIVPFFLEHFAGFGSLVWLWPISTGASVWIVGREWRTFLANKRVEAVFHAAFAYALCWRYSFPDISPSSEKLTDLTFVANYSAGDRLPPPDRWLPPAHFDMYYSLQHYGAALMGRVLGLSAGQAYNLGFCILIAAITTAAAGASWLLVRRRLPAMLLTAAFVFGGTGMAPFMRLVMPAPQLHSSVRLIGSTLQPDVATEPFGKWLLRANRVTPQSLDLPVELFSYLPGLGDFHPPMSGYLLLTLALLSMLLIESGQASRQAFFLLAALIPLSIASNAWDLPILAFLIAGYVAYRIWARQEIPWKILLAGFGVAAALMEPFLANFAVHADSQLAIRLVPAGVHTPSLLALLVFYPVLALLALHAFFGERSRFSIALCIIWCLLLAASEIAFIDDVYAEKFERFNTALKWWGWMYSGIVLAVGGLNLRSPSRICRWSTAAILILISAYAADLGKNLLFVPKIHAGHLNGDAWIRDDGAERAVLDFLAAQPASVVLERLPQRSYVRQPAVAIFAGQSAFLGWANHEDIWRSYRADIDHRLQQIETFYRGELPDSAQWLDQNGIKFVLWLKDDNQLPRQTFDQINNRIGERYFWNEFYRAGDYRIGLWSLSRTAPGGYSARIGE